MSNNYVKKIIKSLLIPFYKCVNIILFPLAKSKYFSEIEKIPRSTQLFFMTRFDLGPCLLMMHYAQCWHRERGPSCLVVFTTHMERIVQLAPLICPDVRLIHFNNFIFRVVLKIFRNEIVQFYTLIKIYSFACCRWPHALFLYDMNFCRKQTLNVSCYVSAFDPVLKLDWPFSDRFLSTYLHVREFADYRRPVFEDMIRLHYVCTGKKEKKSCETQSIERLKEKFQLDRPYVVMNLNCKPYSGLRNNRRIQFPERYSTLIDYLIEKGYSVVIQGRNEQPKFSPRKGLLDYCRLPEASPANDFYLCAGASFGIFNKTGPEIFCAISNVPVLGLNYIELSCITPNSRCRFYPKHLWDEKSQAYIHWKELIQRPSFYDLGSFFYEDEVKYIDLDESEMIEAAKEFMQLVQRPSASWLEYTSLQREFKQALHPAHLDLFEVIDVPCEAYLASPKFKRHS